MGNVHKLPNMHFRTWRVASKKFSTMSQVKKFCEDNGVPNNPVHINKLNPAIKL